MKVLLLMGSDSDLEKMEPALAVFRDFKVDCELRVCSAHRSPEKAHRLATEAEGMGFSLIICAAGLAAHLAGVVASSTSLPVIGLPLAGGALNGLDALYATVQMPGGVPVATVGINHAKNAALLAIRILALVSPELREALHRYREQLAAEVELKDAKLQEKLKKTCEF